MVQLTDDRDEIISIPVQYFQLRLFHIRLTFSVSRSIKPTLLMNLNTLKEKSFPTEDPVLGTYQAFNNYLLTCQ